MSPKQVLKAIGNAANAVGDIGGEILNVIGDIGGAFISSFNSFFGNSNFESKTNRLSNSSDNFDGQNGDDRIYGNGGDDTLYGDHDFSTLKIPFPEPYIAYQTVPWVEFYKFGARRGNKRVPYPAVRFVQKLAYTPLDDDFLSGGDGNDRLYGNRGNDTLQLHRKPR